MYTPPPASEAPTPQPLTHDTMMTHDAQQGQQQGRLMQGSCLGSLFDMLIQLIDH